MHSVLLTCTFVNIFLGGCNLFFRIVSFLDRFVLKEEKDEKKITHFAFLAKTFVGLLVGRLGYKLLRS